MKAIIEVVATNMVSGHVAISQESLEIFQNYPRKRALDAVEVLIADFRKLPNLTTKVGDILITRNLTVLKD